MTKIRAVYRKSARRFLPVSRAVTNLRFNESHSTEARVVNRQDIESGHVSDKDGTSGHHSLAYKTLARSANSGGNDEYVDSQFVQPPARVPKKAIILATFLLVFGSALLAIAITSLIRDDKEMLALDRVVPLLVIGTLVFIPGFYHVRIAYFAFLGVAGYNYDDIPEFD